MFVLALIGIFYVAVTAVGAISRLYTPKLLISGETDAAVLLLPQAVLGSGPVGIAARRDRGRAGAWAAFLSTSSGLVVSIAGVLVHRRLGPGAAGFRMGGDVVGGLVPLLVALIVMRLEFAEAVALVFALAASTFCPLLVLGIWWRGLTPPGAVAGVATGGVLAGTATCCASRVTTLPGVARRAHGAAGDRERACRVPGDGLVSIATRKGCPVATDQFLLRLHAPERLGLTPWRRAAFPRPGHLKRYPRTVAPSLSQAVSTTQHRAHRDGPRAGPGRPGVPGAAQHGCGGSCSR